MPQFFKGDALEKKFYESGRPIAQQLSLQKTEFYNNAYSTFALGDLIYDSGRAPLANAIPRTIFREAFATIFEAFLVAGTFESYLTVFRNIFGPTVSVTFTVPAPGKLNMAIVAAGTSSYNFLARFIEDNAYVFGNVLTQDGEHILFRTIKGFESQYDLEKMLFEMVPDGIFTQITLTIG